MTSVIEEADVETVATFFKQRFADIKVKNNSWGTAAQNVIDCVLSLNRNYEKVVKPRVATFGEQNPSVKTICDLRDLIGKYDSPFAFCADKLDYKDKRRADTLSGVVNYLLTEICEHEGGTEAERLSNWANHARPGDYLAVGVAGFGLAGFQYLRMLFGVQTTKPDVHIVRFVNETTGKRFNDVQALIVMERAAKRTQLPLREVDGVIWNERASKSVAR